MQILVNGVIFDLAGARLAADASTISSSASSEVVVSSFRFPESRVELVEFVVAILKFLMWEIV